MAQHFISPSRVKPKLLDRDGARGVSVRYLVGREQGASKFFLRQYTLKRGGTTSLDNHLYEHEVYILKGKARVKVGGWTKTLGPGKVVYVPSNVVHQFRNAGDEELVFLCVKGAEELYSSTKRPRSSARPHR